MALLFSNHDKKHLYKSHSSNITPAGTVTKMIYTSAEIVNQFKIL